MARQRRTENQEKKETKHIMSEKDIKDWDELYFYVKDTIMGYDSNQKLPNFMILRLKGLLNGKFAANNKTRDMANYSYEVVLLTFKSCYPTIIKGFRSQSFRNEQHKFNYAMSIVERNLNDIYLRMKRAESAKQKESITIKQTAKEDSYVHTFVAPERKKLSSDLADIF